MGHLIKTVHDGDLRVGNVKEGQCQWNTTTSLQVSELVDMVELTDHHVITDVLR